MANHHLDPDLLAEIDSEREYASSHGNYSKRFKMEKGERALVRILPVNLIQDQPERRQWFARVGFHWNMKRFVICPRTTQPLFGGDPEAVCPVCQSVEHHLKSRSEEIHKIANNAASWPQWLVYLLVWEVYKKGDDDPIPSSAKERLIPQAFWLKKPAWLDLSDRFKRSCQRNENLGILNPFNGYDIMLKKDDRGNMTLERAEDPSSIDDGLVKSYEQGLEFVDGIFSKVKMERLEPNTPEELEEFALKFDDFVTSKQSGGNGSSRAGRAAAPVDEDEDVTQATRGSSRASVSRPTPGPSTRRSAPPPSSIEEEFDAVPEGEPEPAPAPVAVTRPAPPRTNSAPPPSTRQITPPPARSHNAPVPRSIAPPPEDDGGDGEDVPPESVDHAPAAEAEPQPAPRSTPAPAGRLSDKIRSNVSRLNNR